MTAATSPTPRPAVESAPGPAVCDTAVTESVGPAEWDAYVRGREAGAIFHRRGWDEAFAVYRLPVVRLAAVRDGRVVGVLPLVRQKSLAFGDRLVSLPWFDAAGLIAETEADGQALLQAAQARAAAAGVSDLEIRQQGESALSPHVRRDKVLMRLDLPPDPEALWGGLKAKVRNQVRKGEKSGLAIETGGAELLPDFFDVYSRNMRDLGSPSHAPEFFEAVARSFPDETRVHVVRSGGKAVGAGLTLANGRSVEIPWASSLREFNSVCVNHFMYWNLLRAASAAGVPRFHFGRSTRDSGTYQFKRQWGAEEAPLSWCHFGPAAAAAVETPAHEKMGWAVKVWQRLPVWAARRIGPRVISKVA